MRAQRRNATSLAATSRLAGSSLCYQGPPLTGASVSARRRAAGQLQVPFHDGKLARPRYAIGLSPRRSRPGPSLHTGMQSVQVLRS